MVKAESTISITEIMNVMNERDEHGEKKPFTISFFTANMKKETGGELIHVEKAIKCSLKADAKGLHLVGVRPVEVESKNAHDYSVHLPLIHEFNGKLATL